MRMTPLYGDLPALAEVDPSWAWTKYQPAEPLAGQQAAEESARLPWNLTAAAHLYRRAGFAGNWDEFQRAVAEGPEATVSRLLEGGPETAAFYEELQRTARPLLASGNLQNLPAWWLYALVHSPHPLQEKMTLFWHGHFATSAAKVANARLMYQQNQLLRREALGSFRRLVEGISTDPAMLLWLDSAVNRRLKPNENYARELMELFALGIGHYTEPDIKEAARAFTGWEVRNEQFRFNPNDHDAGEKTVLGQRGAWTGEDVVRIVLDQPAAPRFLVAKLFRFLISETAAPPPKLIEPLAEGFRQRDYDVRWLVETMLRSNLLFSTYALHQKVKSPAELAVGLVRALEVSPNMYALGEHLSQMGQGLFYPPNVKGWDGGTAWINSSTLLARANLVPALPWGGPGPFGNQSHLAQVLQKHGLREPARVVDWLVDELIAGPIPEEARQELVDLLGGDPKSAALRQEALVAAVHAIATLAEFQLC